MLSATFDTAFYSGTSSTFDILGKYDFVLNGRPYMIDTRQSAYTGHSEYMHSSVPLLRQQADQSQSPSEASINPEDLWRRSQDSWHHGAGQSFVDRGESDIARFHASKGVNVWTKWELSLLPDTDQKHSTINSNLGLVTVGTYLYYTDGQTLLRTQDVTVDAPTWTTITGTDASTISSITSDGYNVYLAQNAGVYSTTRGAATAASFNALVCTLLRYVNGRLMAANANSIYNITASGAAPTALFTHPNTDFSWVDFTEGPTAIYAAGFSGDKSIIYRTSVKTDGSGLDVPFVAGVLPDGEIVRSIQGYLGFVLVGTDKGVRLAAVDSTGNLTFGALIPTGNGVRCFEPQDRFVWYGLTNYDGTSTGLGRIDLSAETAPLTPAYASDLMATAQGNVVSAVTFQSRRVFTVALTGVFAEEAVPVDSGTLDSGQITYRLPDDKVAMFVDVRHDSVGQHSVSLSVDGGGFSLLDTHTTHDDPFLAGHARGLRFEHRLTLTAVDDVGPVIRAVTLRAFPASALGRLRIIPVLLAEELALRNGDVAIGDPGLEREALIALHDNVELVTLQEGQRSVQVVVKDYEWRAYQQTSDFRDWNGTMALTIKELN